MGDNTTFTRAYCNRVSSHLWVVVVVICSELSWPHHCKVSSFNNANVIWVIIQVLLDLRVSSHLWVVEVGVVVVHSVKDIPLVSMAVWSNRLAKLPQTSTTQHQVNFFIFLE